MKPSEWIEAKAHWFCDERDFSPGDSRTAAIIAFLDSAHGDAVPGEAAMSKPDKPWDEGGRDEYFAKLSGDDRLVAGLDPIPDTDIIRAAEGVVLERGRYLNADGDLFTVDESRPAELMDDGSEMWMFEFTPGGYTPTATPFVRRVEAKAQPEAKCERCERRGAIRNDCPDCEGIGRIETMYYEVGCPNCKGTGRAKLGDPTCKPDLQVAERPIVVGSTWLNQNGDQLVVEGLWPDAENLTCNYRWLGGPNSGEVFHCSRAGFYSRFTWLRDPAPTPSEERAHVVDVLPNKPGPVREPDRYQETIASRFAGGDTIGELVHDYDMREDLVARAIRVTLGYLLDQHPKLTKERDEALARLTPETLAAAGYLHESNIEAFKQIADEALAERDEAREQLANADATIKAVLANATIKAVLDVSTEEVAGLKMKVAEADARQLNTDRGMNELRKQYERLVEVYTSTDNLLRRAVIERDQALDEVRILKTLAHEVNFDEAIASAWSKVKEAAKRMRP